MPSPAISQRPLSTAQLIRMLPALRQRREAAQERASKALAEVDALQRIIEGVEGLAGDAATPTPLFLRDEEAVAQEETPRGQEAVRLVMNEAPDRIWPLSAITRAVMQRGWIDHNAKTPQAAIRAATQRLAGSGKAEKVAPGRYRLTQAGRSDDGET